MAYAYDRSAEPGHDNVPNYTTSHSPELRDNSSRWDESAHTKTSRPNNMTTSSTDDGVSPELIERITERVRKESMIFAEPRRPQPYVAFANIICHSC